MHLIAVFGRIVSLLAVLAIGVAVTGDARSQAYPSKPVRIVAPFAAGGGGDTSIRLLGQHLSQEFGQPFIIDNRPGANGIIGAQEALRSPPDGYTLFYGSTTTLAANPTLMKSIPYDPVKDFAPITRVGLLPFLLVINPALPSKSVQELIAYAKANPGKLSYASANATGQVAGSTFAQMAGVEMLHVPYKTNSAAVTDTISGTVSMVFADLPSVLQHVGNGRLRALGVTTARRTSLLPDVPTIAETGLPGYEVIAWTAMTARAGTSPDIVKRQNAVIVKVLGKPEVKEEFARLGIELVASTPDELAAYILSETEKWARSIQAAGIQPE